MQGLSSFFVLVNGAFSKQITTAHVMGGFLNLKRKTLWELPRSKRSRQYSIEKQSWTHMVVDGKRHDILSWLRVHEKEWFPEWNKWRQQVALKLVPETPEFKFILKAWNQHIPLGLVHPKAVKSAPEEPVTKETVDTLVNSQDQMTCMPYVVVGALLNTVCL